MQTSFKDLVGTAIVPTCVFNTEELTDLVPALDTGTAVHGMTSLASEAQPTFSCPTSSSAGYGC